MDKAHSDFSGKRPAAPAPWSLFDMVIRGARVEVVPVRRGSTDDVMLHVAECDAERLLSESTRLLIQQTGDRGFPGYLPLARIQRDEASPRGYRGRAICGPTSNLGTVIDAFAAVVANVGRWRTFNEMLQTRYEHDMSTDSPLQQPQIRYTWFQAAIGPKNVVPIRVFDQGGLLLDRTTPRVPIVTSTMSALRLIQHANQIEIEELTGHTIPCLKCFLEGVTAELGPRTLRGAILDGQWPVDFFILADEGVDATGPGATQFIIKDAGDEYLLSGCAKDGGPYWERQPGRGASARGILRW